MYTLIIIHWPPFSFLKKNQRGNIRNIYIFFYYILIKVKLDFKLSPEKYYHGIARNY